MIGRLRGTIVNKRPPFLLLDVNGVGYELEAPMSTFYGLPGPGNEVSLFTHLLVREDAQVLYAFVSDGERAMFRSLLKVNGVGARMALAILSGMSADDFGRCVQAGDTASLVRLPGIGKKTAERLIVEMRDRLAGLDLSTESGAAERVSLSGSAAESAVSDAVSALIALGYRSVDASRMVRAVDCADRTSEEIIREALKAAGARN